MTPAVRPHFRCKLAVPLVLAMASVMAGCRTGATLLPPVERRPIDRKVVEYPTGFNLQPFVRGLTAPAALCFDNEANILIAEGATAESSVHIFGFRPNGTRFEIYPIGRKIPFVKQFTLYGPVGGMVVEQGRIYVSHRDADGKGVITAFGYDGSHQTIVADLPAQGDYPVTDLAVAPNGKIVFGLGAATNSGVVGLDNWASGWVRNHPNFCDKPATDLKLLGYRFDTPNPIAGLFGPGETAVTAPFQPFGSGNKLRIARAPNDKPTGAVYAVNPMGGGLQVVAHGIRYPRGLAYNEYGRLYMTNDGMELRGTRPVQDDRDSILRVVQGTWYGFPDFTTDLRPITELKQPPQEMLLKTGYPELSFLVDHAGSGLLPPSGVDRSNLVGATFQPLSGAAKMDFVRPSGPFRDFAGSGSSAIVALSGDRAPFATSGRKLIGPIGFKLVHVNVDTHQVRDFVKNTEGGPASRLKHHPEALERPVDVKFGPDGSMYILDMGDIVYKDGKERVRKGSGRIFRLVPIAQERDGATTRRAEEQ